MTFRLGYYDPGQLGTIVRRSAGILGVEIADDAAEEIAARSRGTPRIANRILRRVRDVAEVRHAGAITTAVAQEALELLEVDEQGLERIDRELLEAVALKFGGGPVGLSTLAVALGEEPDTIEDVYEPYLLQLGFLQRTPRGRVITDLGREHVGVDARRREPVLSGRDLDARDGGAARGARAADPAPRRGLQGASTRLEEAEVSVELVDGSLHRLRRSRPSRASASSASARTARTASREELIVPLGAIRELRIGAPAPRAGARLLGRRRRPGTLASPGAHRPPSRNWSAAPGRRRAQLEQRAAACRLRVGELAALVLPRRPRAAPP